MKDTGKIGRNDPCPCGSGKKYKKCCGSSPETLHRSNQVTGLFKLNESIAYKGEIGRLRQDFCIKQIDQLKSYHKQIALKQTQEAEARNKMISCYKGCASCCTDFVAARLHECEAIVYYLYQHKSALSLFLQHYEHWWIKIDGTIGIDTLDDIYRCNIKMWNSGFTDESRRRCLNAAIPYMKLNIPCPFLKEYSCLIYEVRPLVCSGQAATTPAAWCNRESPNYDKREIISPLPDKTPFLEMYHRSLSSVVPVGYCMPQMVYIILKGGFWYLSNLAGSEELLNEFKYDPEVKKLIDNPKYKDLVQEYLEFPQDNISNFNPKAYY